MSLLDRWVANTKRVLAKDKNTGSEYEFESIFPDGAPDGTAFSAENMNKIIDAVNGLDESKGQPNGIATLNASGKLAQMPTAADVGAVKLYWSTLVNETSATPNKYNFDDYITPGNVVSVDNYASAQSIANIPEAVPGKLYVLPLRTDDQGRNDYMQEYHTVTGNVWCRHRFFYSGDVWGKWASGRPNYINVPASGGGNIGWAYRNAHGEVNLTIYATLSTPVNSSTYRTIGTLPEGYVPDGTFEVPAILRGSKSGLEIGMLLIGSAGSIQVARALGSTAAGLDMVRTQVNYYTKA